jgi:hypothetical protein
MLNPDHSANPEAYLKWEMALLTAAFATEQAVGRLRRAVKLGRSVEIAEWANHAATAVKEVAELVTLPDDDADTAVTIQASVAGCLNTMTRAGQADDTDGVLNAGELVGDAVAKYAAFLKNSVTT